ncbi:beta-L-arabinofuranosidase domain-containing protein [Sphingomonas nostoxanthinifaciens]|uniref:beta-L-arabinofuranosidase domain-containing protein n=1 Tax=Sphingomonas nostoxanthinifaciens TaxID=2872652 RepID=UPI001CC1DF64|nr:beta-L-arabinofuranosidase domain-containing protein [Sphingomonas nostoxanthinifaciens]UAK26248.1 glycoside hydrolase family 127 protein [Sphingomonas nostoxanthinifaciens]
MAPDAAGSAPQAAIALDGKLARIPFWSVALTDRFWAPKVARNREVTLPLELAKLDRRPIDWMLDGGILEAAIYTERTAPDPARAAKIRQLAGAINAIPGQLPEHRDFEITEADVTALGDRTTLSRSLERAEALRLDFARSDPPFAGGERDAMCCAALYRVTGDRRHLALATHYLDIRGRGDAVGRSRHNQSYAPVIEQREAVGHAVNCVTLILSMLEVGLLSGDRRYSDAATRMWTDIVSSKMYVTGGVGSTGNEGFGPAYDLPNLSAYSESCAVLMFSRLNHRLHLATGEARFIDVLERSLYNNAVAGVSADGGHFFYVNRLASAGSGRDQRWQNASLECCPPNLVRFFASMADYLFAQDASGAIFVNLYASSEASFAVSAGTLRLTMTSGMPWDGASTLRVSSTDPVTATLKLRIPGWARGEAAPGNLYHFIDGEAGGVSIALNGRAIPVTPDAKGYVTLTRTWQPDDRIEMHLPMPVRRIAADPRVRACGRRHAFQRGPMVYCAEWPEAADGKVLDLLVDKDAPLSARFDPAFMGGAVLIDTVGRRTTRPDEAAKPVRLIPYHLWANRGAGEMSVWLLSDDLQVGDVGPAGGLIFYRNPNAARDGWRYLEAAPADQSLGAPWGGFRREIAGAGGTAIGAGRCNTADMLAAGLEPGSAARIAEGYRLNGIGGWFIPSRDELSLLYTALAAPGVGDFHVRPLVDNCEYWASTQLSADMASHVDFADGGRVHGDDKDFPRRVRVIRAI